MTNPGSRRDTYAGALMALIGAFAIVEGLQYGVGDLASMGSGFFPVVLGAGLILMGILMAAMAKPAPDGHTIAAPDWRGAAAIIAAVAVFIALARTAGLAPAIFACVFVGALGTRATTWREALLLAAGVTVFGVLLFSFGLQVQFPILVGVWR